MARPQYQQHLGVVLSVLATTYVACSSYDGSNRVSQPPQLDPDADYGGASVTAGASAGGSAPTNGGVGGLAMGMAGAQAAGGSTSGGSTSGGSTSGGSTNGGSTNGGSTNGGSTNGGSTNGGAANKAGSGGAPLSSGGAAGGGLAGAGSAGSPAIEQLLSQGKPATSDSEQTGHLAALGNDGAADTRWCAADGSVGHYWQVDLGQSYALSKLAVSWEKAAIYQFKVDGSLDNVTWNSLLDQTQSTNAVADQTYPLSSAPNARYVRVTTTTLPNTNIWASFFEFQVYGH